MRVCSGKFDASKEVYHVQGGKKMKLSQPQQIMAQDRKKQVSGEIPFHFMQEMGHSPRAMEQFFDLSYQARQVLTDAVCISDEPEERRETALKSLANGGEGYCERF